MKLTPGGLWKSSLSELRSDGLGLHPEKSRLLSFGKPASCIERHPCNGQEIRLSRIHPLLGESAARILGYQAKDGKQESQQDDTVPMGLVPQQ